ncbi:MAG: PA4642 family protein [Pseudomonadales bacterium]|nr:PA4642 family protein [Pseudomonadales bacterium]MCP5185744.1 PA4642 family protein [Pseudomonadales bacterium]
MRPDKKAIVDEVWDDARIESFLDKSPMGEGEDPDYSLLLNAYRGMRAEDFARFIRRYLATGRSLDACGRDGRTLRETISGHRHASDFLRILDAAR